MSGTSPLKSHGASAWPPTQSSSGGHGQGDGCVTCRLRKAPSYHIIIITIHTTSIIIIITKGHRSRIFWWAALDLGIVCVCILLLCIDELYPFVLIKNRGTIPTPCFSRKGKWRTPPIGGGICQSIKDQDAVRGIDLLYMIPLGIEPKALSQAPCKP